MIRGRSRRSLSFLICLALPPGAMHAQTRPQNPSLTKQPKKPADSALDAGAVTNGVYRNQTLALSCKIPPGWVLRTDEMNAREERKEEEKQANAAAPAQSSEAS